MGVLWERMRVRGGKLGGGLALEGWNLWEWDRRDLWRCGVRGGRVMWEKLENRFSLVFSEEVGR